ncbi:hypothetical protein [Rhizobium sp. Leaf383]|uniref:hypothetical protein n=1 Tax=Rhizobium sp. Leaf383 TaxID=1736357 RepID=UPI000713A48C|nr:hypothetical protein [Rhizobium sp. Leaf383]KQS84323.1 hypothetical protein ASG58_21370 [Rhizobium sp. Leaf383]
MSVSNNEIRKTFGKIFDQFGIPEYDIERRGKHPALTFDLAGRRHRVVLSSTPSDYRAQQNKISFLKRYIRNIHALH